MFFGRVIGTVVCTKKEKQLDSLKLLVVQKVNHDGEDEGSPIVAADAVRAGVGDFVFLSKGKESSLPFGDLTHPLDASITGIIDTVYIKKEDN